MRTLVLAVLLLAAAAGAEAEPRRATASEQSEAQAVHLPADDSGLERVPATQDPAPVFVDPLAAAEAEPQADVADPKTPDPDSQTDVQADVMEVNSRAHAQAVTDPNLQAEHDEPDGDRASTSCLSEPVAVRRAGFGGPLLVSLTDCAGHPNRIGLGLLSKLAQPKPPVRYRSASDAAEPDRLVRPLNPELLVRLQRIADHFPTRSLELVSGYRPRARPGSRHRSGDALDLRVEGVGNAELSAFARTLDATGVGYYPNSRFVHIDVRSTAFYWVDRSKPGAPPDYAPQPAPSVDAATADSVVSTEQKADGLAEETPDPIPASAEPIVAELTAAELDTELRQLAERALAVLRASP